MNKEEIYRKYASLPAYDGTFSDYLKVYMNHSQLDKTVLQRACQVFSRYIQFCMGISVYYKSERDGEYKQFAYGDETLDYSQYQIELLYENIEIYPDTDLTIIDYPNIEGLVKIKELEEGYRAVFNRMLNGEVFLEDEFN